jgi:hypothetical protein
MHGRCHGDWEITGAARNSKKGKAAQKSAQVFGVATWFLTPDVAKRSRSMFSMESRL